MIKTLPAQICDYEIVALTELPAKLRKQMCIGT